MKTFLLLITLFSFNLSEASLAGDWIGWGTWKFKGEGEGMHCSEMKMKWSETSSSIAIDGGSFEGDFFAMILEKTKWKIQDGKLFDETQKEVGSYDGSYFQVYMPGPNERTKIHIALKRQANHIDYQEVWYNPDEKVYVIESRLFLGGQ